ncbi:hypothetical protein SO802_026431 [Lithocarpus litseifolius]|uniref:Reverse transcriptase zinc-binding domain-containing protein n=1 Tax=Lithocarpus litseifolius TaxID=425828 RepID=A0AAW2BZU0_9ROSI
MAALPILKAGCCWHVGEGSSIKVQADKWLPNHPTNKILHSANEDVEDWLVSDLIDLEMHWWRRELITTIFHREDAEAICQIPLSHRRVADSIIWLHARSGGYSIKTGYHVARRVLKHEDWAESSGRSDMQKVWQALWRLKVPNRIKIFGWRLCHGILPTWVNLARRRIIRECENVCPTCAQFSETEFHVLRECLVAQDIWARSRIKLQKCHLGQQDMIQLIHYLLNRLDIEDVELFLVQAWVVWNKRNSVMHGGSVKEPSWLNRRAVEYLEEFKQAQEHLTIPMRQAEENVWRPPPHPFFKLNFDAAIFMESNSSGFGAVIWNEQGKVMAAMAAKGPPVSSSEEAETLVCRKALEFAVDVGFSELVVEGDNVNVMRAVSSSSMNLS